MQEQHLHPVQRAAAARAAAAELRQRGEALGRATREGWAMTLVTLTRLADQRPVTEEQLARLRRAAILVGRDPIIEDAKLQLRGEYAITGEQAFGLLRSMSQRSNKKVRDVAADVVAQRYLD